MTTDLYSTVFFQDGEQFTFDDANNMQRFVRAQMTDQLLQELVGAASNAGNQADIGGADGGNVSTLWAYTMNPGRAFLRQGSANNKIQLAPGTLLQKIANSDGNDATLVPFTFAGTEEWTLASGDATNPRVDLLQMKLEYITDTPVSVDFMDAATRALSTNPTANTRLRVQATLTVKQGTPAASPRIPDPDAGFVPVGSVVVGHGWTSATAPTFGLDQVESGKAVVSDQRMPLAVRAHAVTPVMFFPVSNWSVDATWRDATASSGTNAMAVPYRGPMGRLVGVRIEHSAAFAGVNLGTYATGAVGAHGGIKGNSLTSASTAINELFARTAFEGAHNPNAGPTILPSTVNAIGMPLWQNGCRVPVNPTGSVSVVPSLLAVLFGNDTNGQQINTVTFYIAGV